MERIGHPIAVDHLEVSHYRIPTDSPESDGTLQWDHTALSIVTVRAGGVQGMGYTFAGAETASVIHGVLAKTVRGRDAMSPTAAYMAMWQAIRNSGRPGVCSMAISALDCALWDLKARLLGVPLATLLGTVRQEIPVYGSGGFTSYSNDRLAEQLGGWAETGIKAVKMKIGRDPDRDPERISVAREAIGPATRLYVDANGAYSPRQAMAQMEMLARHDVRWFEEPVTSDNRAGLRFVREHAPSNMDIATGEYGYDPFYFLDLLKEEAVDVLQADIGRCGGVTAFMQVAAMCQAFNVPLSAHTAPALHAPVACAAIPFTEQEYFYDHVRIEQMFFDGVPALKNGALHLDLSRPGNGLELRRSDAMKYAA